MDLRQSIHAFVCESFLVDDFDDDDSFLGTGIVDSLGIAQLVAFLEQAFGITVGDDELVPANLDSVARVAAFVEAKLDGKSVAA